MIVVLESAPDNVLKEVGRSIAVIALQERGLTQG
jgi:hypothetical protein